MRTFWGTHFSRRKYRKIEFERGVEFLLNFQNPSRFWDVIFAQKKNLFKRISLKKVTFSIAGKGFEPHDLRVMSSDCAVLCR